MLSLRFRTGESPGTFLVFRGILGKTDIHVRAARAHLGIERVGVVGDVGLVDPGGLLRVDRIVRAFLFGRRHESRGVGGG